MQIEVKTRNVSVGDEFKQRVERRFAKVARQVSPLARMEIELCQEKNPAIRDSEICECVLHLKGTTLRAHHASDSMTRSVNLVAETLARQVKRHRDKRRKRVAAPQAADQAALGL
jgi:putative sigma-54 modulation protein